MSKKGYQNGIQRCRVQAVPTRYIKGPNGEIERTFYAIYGPEYLGRIRRQVWS